MTKYLVKRLLTFIPMLFCVILVVFLIMSLTPGDPASNILPLNTRQEVRDAYNESVGFTGSLVDRFVFYLKGLVAGNIPSYVSRDNIFDEIAVRFPNTFKLGTMGFLGAAIIGVSLGILSAIKQYSFLDTTVTTVAVMFASIPGFFIGICLILIFSVHLGVLPSFGFSNPREYVLPVATLILTSIPTLSRMTRSAMLSAMNQDYIRTARAKGCSERRVIWKHALKNASLPILTLLLTGYASILGGAAICETVFSVPGLGIYMLDAVKAKNVPVVMTSALLIAFIFMVAMLFLDIFSAIIDPKIRARYEK